MAPSLLGSTVATVVGGSRVAVRLDEVEAYDGANDPASHAYRGRTPRNLPMFGPPGTIYVYLSYGIHWCMNIVVGASGNPAAVLLRGGELIEGRSVASERRGRTDHLADGPGKLCQALGVDGSVSGSALGEAVSFTLGELRRDERITATPRIGISKAVDRPWRFVIEARRT